MKAEMYRYSHAGIRYWSIEIDYLSSCLAIRHGKLGGSIQYKEEFVEENESGRTLDEQLEHRMASRINAKKDNGYRDTVEEAKACQGANTLGFHRPMLAARWDRMTGIDYEKCYVQMKYNGHRCLVTMTDDGIIAYSRKGRIINTINHILEGIELPLGMTIDGELYCHGVKFQRISSWAKRMQPDTLKLKYIVYDVISKDGYEKRFEVISNLKLGSNALVAFTGLYVSRKDIQNQLSSAIRNGFEGLILRQTGVPYEVNKRSKSLIKVKQFLDGEFKVVSIRGSADGWAILTCDVGNGLTFDVSAPGTIAEKYEVIRSKKNFIGKLVNVSFAEYTIDGKPFHPSANHWHITL